MKSGESVGGRSHTLGKECFLADSFSAREAIRWAELGWESLKRTRMFVSERAARTPSTYLVLGVFPNNAWLDKNKKQTLYHRDVVASTFEAGVTLCCDASLLLAVRLHTSKTHIYTTNILIEN